MQRLTSERCNGIKTGYWSPAKKEDLCQRLGRYEDSGLEPEEIKPVVHAHWEEVRIPSRDLLGFPDWKRGYCCSHCKAESADFRKSFRRCPNCGAKMDEEAVTDG